MKKYIDAEQLSKKIESIGLYAQKSADYNDGRNDMKMMVLDIIDSLQQEQPEVDLEKEINACWQNWLSPSNQKEVEGVLPKTEFTMYARHFYELGLKARNQ